MEVFTTKEALQDALSGPRSEAKKIGFVPTMGALHEGHVALIAASKAEADLTVCSIFVNPTQFNDPSDLEKYPRPIERDKALLESVGCDLLFLPSVEEMYPDPDESWFFDLGKLDSLWEGAKRPGHYQGVTQVVHKLFELVQPSLAFFGQKDFQQCMVIQRMIGTLQMPIHLRIVETIRDADGLAKSSRNVRLSPSGRAQALALSKALFLVRDGWNEGLPLKQLKKRGLDFLEEAPGVDLEYFAICDPVTLEELSEIGPDQQRLVVLIAAWVDGVRLIDNIVL